MRKQSSFVDFLPGLQDSSDRGQVDQALLRSLQPDGAVSSERGRDHGRLPPLQGGRAPQGRQLRHRENQGTQQEHQVCGVVPDRVQGDLTENFPNFET